MHRAINTILIANHRELAVPGFDCLFTNTLDIAFFLEAIADQVGDCANADAPRFGEYLEIRTTCHAAVFIEDFDNNGSRRQSSQPRKITTSFRMPRPGKHPAGVRH